MQPRIERLIFVFCLFLIAGRLAAEMVAKLPQVMQPTFITFTNDRVYVVEESSKIHIYDRGSRGIVFEKTFGQTGEGPGEFDYIHQLRPLKDHLEIPTLGKFARFSLDGKFLDEIKLPINVFKNAIYHVGENYLARDWRFDNKEDTATIRLYDRNFKMIREIGMRKNLGGISKINLVADYYYARVVGVKIYLVDSGKETTVTVFDANGNRQKEVRLPLEPVKVTDALKEAIIKPIKEQPDMKARWEAFASRLSFPDQTPGLDYFDVSDGKFVTRTYNYRNDSVEFVIFDSQGKQFRRLYLPYTGRLNNGNLFCFFQGKFYYLRENLDEEVWELHSEKVW